jgi:signal transduction histidine kinase
VHQRRPSASQRSSSVPQRPAWERYGGALALTIVVVLGRLALDPVWGRQHNRHLVFLPTVMLAAWFGGFGPGLLSVALSTLALGHFWTEQASGLHLNSDLVLFFFVSVAVCELVESLQLARARADDARRAHERVMEVVVHDLRNPLTAIKATSEALQSNPGLDAHHRHRLQIIDRSASRMEGLIRDLVDAGQAERGSLQMMLEKENAVSIVAEAIELHAPVARERGVTLESKTPAETIFVNGDRNRLLQLLGNLIGNALRFTPDGGRITVRLEAEAGDRLVRFFVDDTGSGIEPEHLPHVFEQYWKGDPKGTGLGLYIARSIVRGHGGDIGVTSAPGRGASFSFTIPRAL